MAESEIGLTWTPKLPPLPSSKRKSKADSSEVESSLLKLDSNLIDGLFVPPSDPRKLNKLVRKSIKDSAGTSWFDMPAPTVTPEVKKDLELLKLRSFMDPKRHFKKTEKSKELPKYFQVGTVLESASEYFSGRLTKKERKQTLADELLSDPTLKAYRKRKVQEIEEKSRPHDVGKWKIKGRKTWKRAKDRRG